MCVALSTGNPYSCGSNISIQCNLTPKISQLHMTPLKKCHRTIEQGNENEEKKNCMIYFFL